MTSIPARRDIAAYWRHLRATRKAKGKCTDCGKRQPDEGRNRCRTCIKRATKYAKGLREVYFDHCLCWRCQGRLEGRGYTCLACQSAKVPQQRQRRAEKLAAGLCGHCSRPRNLWAFCCDQCAERHRERQRRKRV